MDTDVARSRLKALVASGTDPILLDTEVDDLLVWSERADTQANQPTNVDGSRNTTWVPTYDLFWGASEGWYWKAGKTVDRYTFQEAGGQFKRDQVFNHCLKMAQEYRKVAASRPYSVRSRGNLVIDRLGLTTLPWWYAEAGN